MKPGGASFASGPDEAKPTASTSHMSTEKRPQVPSSNPLPLSASQEAQVRDIFHARVRQRCAQEIQDFAACARDRTFTVSFACRKQHRAMNGCMAAHATQAERDAAREQWFALRMERQREKEHKARVAAAQEDFVREWWGLPENVRLSRQRELDRLAQGGEERVGGMPAKDRVVRG
ncbi:hypothetical protein CDD82_4585 [Ophiocordyceps australis]|uniref:COX assembly mitochondrial protein n=1 Tax=Ophiocordyceps australis TaxID=1399860 RepID=A0A2C5ZSN0_9HYPO|nr:hypothetical protein CDD82_4585 [Ophiocordyceps australis]